MRHSKILVTNKISSGLMGVEDTTVDQKQIVFGTFWRANKTHTDEVYDPDRDDFNEVSLHNRIKGKVPFFYDPKSHLLVWEHSYKVDVDVFIKNFSRVIEYTIGDLLVVNLFLLNESDEIGNFLEQLYTVKRIKLHLRPTNPDIISGVENYEAALRKYNISVQEIIQSVRAGHDIDREVLEVFHVSAKFLLVQNGYGDAQIQGKDREGRLVSYDSKTRPVVRESDGPEFRNEREKARFAISIMKEMQDRVFKSDNRLGEPDRVQD